MTPIGREGVNSHGLHPCIGYFEAPGQPCTYDPGCGSTPCLICWQPLGGVEGPNIGGNIRTINVLHGEDDLSLFYRVHITCAKAHPEEIPELDASAMHGKRGAYDPATPPEHPFLGHPSAGQEHVLDDLSCWCHPYRDPVEPEVVIHREDARA